MGVPPTAAYLYPWDVVGDPAAAERVAGLGVSGAVVAAVYHATRALTPLHPLHRVVTADRTAAYFPVEGWAAPVPLAMPEGAPFGPEPFGADPFGEAVAELAGAGVPAVGWAVLLHVDGVPCEPVVVNAHGDRYGWALCAARPEAVEYAAAAAAAVAARPGLAALELEACGWYGFGHLHAHDKTAGVRFSGALDFLLSLCFCPACTRGYADRGLDPGELRRRVAAVLDDAFAGRPTPSTVDELLGTAVAAAVLAFRDRAGDALRAAVVAAVRSVAGPALPVLLHADPVRHHTGANPGMPVPTAADGVVLNCWAPGRAEQLVPLAGGGRVVASLLGVAGMGGEPASLRDQLERAARAGAHEGRIYHAGIGGVADLAAIQQALA